MASPAIDVYVKLNTGRVTSLQLMPSECVLRIYERVAQEEEVPVNRIQIKYTGKVLNKQHTVGYLGIRAETILKAEVIPVKDWSVTVKLPSDEVVSLDIKNTSSIQEIKNRIEAKATIIPTKQILKFNGFVLNNNSQLAWEACIKNESALEVNERSTVASKDTEDGDEDLKPELSQDDEDKRQELLGTFDAGGRAVEVVFSFDTTGSMYSCLSQVREKVKETVERLLKDIPNIRIGIIVHGDYCDCTGNYVIKFKDLTSEADNLKSFVMDVPSTGGGDTPECYEWVLRKAQQLDWSENSAKALVVIGDANPHPPSYTDQNINWHDELDILKGMGVKVYGVRAQHETMSAPFYEELADRTGGAYIPFKQFSLIKDMFLAVCYNEAGQDQLQAFSEEVEKEGRMTADTKEMFTKMEKMTENTVEKEEDKPKRYVKQSWWDPTLDESSPQYTYNANTDEWSTIRSQTSTNGSLISEPVTLRSPSKSPKKKTRWFSCFWRTE